MNDVDLSDISGNLKMDQSLVVPIGQANITLEDILNQFDSIKYIGEDANQFFLQYSDSMFFNFRDVSLLGSTNPVEETINLFPMIVPPFTSMPTIELNKNLDVGFNTNPQIQRFDIVKANSAKLNIEVIKENIDIDPANVKITLVFPSTNLVFEAGGSSISYTPQSFGNAVDFTVPAFTSYTYNNVNEIPVAIKLDVKSGASPVVVSGTSSLTIKLKFSSVDFKIAYGRFSPSKNDESLEESIDLGDFTSSLPKGLFKLSDPSIKLTATNSFGVKIGVNIEHLKAYRKDEPDYEPIFAKFENDSHSTVLSVDAPSEYGEEIKTVYTFDKNFGKIDQLFDNEVLPNMLNGKFKFSNIGAEEKIDFIFPNAKIKVDYAIKVPMNLKAGSYLELKDTIHNLELDSLLKDDYIEKATLVFKISNGFPIGANFTFKLLGETGNEIISTIKKEYTIDAGPVDNNGVVVKNQIASQLLLVEVAKSQLADLRNTKKIAFVVVISGKEGKPISFEKSNSLGVKLGIHVKGDATFELNSNN
jgi:hypothetical protein